VSWSDEQQPVDVVTAEQQQGGAALTAVELAELTASIEHLSGPDAWDEGRLESALIPVTHYVPRLLAMVAKQQQQDGAAEELRAFLDALPPRIDIVADWTRGGVRNVLTAEALLAVLAERTALAARVAELEGEREADAWDVRGLLMALIVLGSRWPAGLERRANRLRERFADRIAALNADDTEES
jgi:hypothetical protein